MTPEQFTYWLQGFVERDQFPPNEAQWKSVKEHLSTVLTKATPNVVGVGSDVAYHSQNSICGIYRNPNEQKMTGANY